MNNIPKWEYKAVKNSFSKPIVNLNDLGRKGWELVSIIDTPRSTFYFFKRPLLDNK